MTEDQLEQECLGWLGELGSTHLYGPDITPDCSDPEREHYRPAVLPMRPPEAEAQIEETLA